VGRKDLKKIYIIKGDQVPETGWSPRH